MWTMIYRLWLRSVFGVLSGSGWELKGRPFIRVGGRGSSIRIGDRLMAVSRLKDNPIGVPHRVVIRTVADGAKIEIGDDVGLSGCVISAAKSIKIGNRVKIGSGALIMDADMHSLDSDLDKRAREEAQGSKGMSAPIIIDDDVFIGARAMILKGVRVGKAAIVGAGAVVTRNVPAGATVVGNPARVVGADGRE